MRCWNARKGPRMGPKVHEVDSARSTNKAWAELKGCLLRARAQPKEDEEGFSESCRGCAKTRVPANLKIFSKTTQIVKKLPKESTYHLMVTTLTEFDRISPDHTRCHLYHQMKGKHMPKLATPKQKLNISITSRMKRRIQDIAKDKGISMNDLVVHALQDFIDRSDGTYQNADLVADRLNQVLNSQMAVINQLNQHSRKLDG